MRLIQWNIKTYKPRFKTIHNILGKRKVPFIDFSWEERKLKNLFLCSLSLFSFRQSATKHPSDYKGESLYTNDINVQMSARLKFIKEPDIYHSTDHSSYWLDDERRNKSKTKSIDK